MTKAQKSEIVVSEASVTTRVRIQKTYKMYVGGQFIRSESGRYFQVKDASSSDSTEVENIARASRKDGRDAVKAAEAAFPSWSARTAYNRGQILYRLAEVMESRASELANEIHRSLGTKLSEAKIEVETSIDRVISYAGWTDKYQSLLASSNPVSGPHFNFSVPEPMGIVVVVAPKRPSLLGLITAAIPVIVGGNVALVLASEDDPRTAITFSECLATSDLPGGVINILTGGVSEVAPHLAKHMGVAALDLWTTDDALATSLETEAVGSVKRVRRHHVAENAFADDSLAGLRSIERFLELKTIWHPVGVLARPPRRTTSMTTLHDFELKTIDGKQKNLADFKGKVTLVVNVASECGLTPQYAGLEKLYEELGPKGLEIAGIPANEFGAQEPGTDSQIASFCETKFGVKFPMFSKIVVKGAAKHPLYEWLTTQSKPAGEVTWNFEKFLIGKDGSIVGRFSPKVEPNAPELRAAIESALSSLPRL